MSDLVKPAPRASATTVLEQMFLDETLHHIRKMPEPVLDGWIHDTSILSKKLAGCFDWKSFDVWQTLAAPEWESTDEIIAQFEADEHITIDPWGYKALKTISDWGGSESLNLVRMTPKDIGINVPTARSEVTARAKQFGLQVCPRYVAPALRWSYRPQKEVREYTTVVSEPIDVGGGEQSVFAIRSILGYMPGVRSGDPNHLWHRFDAGDGSPECLISETVQLVFVRSW